MLRQATLEAFPFATTARDVFSRLFSNTIVPSASIKTRIGGLDELRGIATLWVMVCHGRGLTTWLPQPFSGYGYHGVVLFFIVSGYLITKILIGNESKGEPLGAFYIRRFIRIWPLMVLVLLLGCALRAANSENIVFNLLMVNNYSMAAGVEPPFRTDVMWSLAIEEQFYLFWPLIFFIVPKRLIPPLLGLTIFVGFCFDSGLIQTGHIIVSKTTQGAMQYIALGSAIAFGKVGLRTALVAGISFFIVLFTNGITVKHHGQVPWQAWYIMTWLMFFLVYYTVHMRPLIKSAFLAHIGRICYSMYLLHFFVSAFVMEYIGKTAVVGPLVFAFGSYAAGLAAFHLIERPVLSTRGAIEESPKLQVMLLLLVSATVLACVVTLVVRLAPFIR